MFNRKKDIDEKVDSKKLNELISFSRNVVKILYVLLIVLGVYFLIKLAKEIKILDFVFTLLKVVAPLFIGFAIAWLFDPFVKFHAPKLV